MVHHDDVHWPSPERLGPFLAAARRLVPPGQRPPLGADGVRYLLEEVRRVRARQRDEDTPGFVPAGEGGPDTAARFVESAGAYLAVLLIEAHDGRHAARRGQHRVLIGEGGSVDPFAVATTLLESETPARALAAALRDAEDEAAGLTSESRVVIAFLAELTRAGLEPRKVVRARCDRWLELDLELGRVEVDLQRLLPLADDGAALRRGAARVVGLLPGVKMSPGERELRWEDAAPRLLPRLIGPASKLPVDEVYARALPLGEELRMGLQLHYPGRARFLRADEVGALGEERSLLRAGANLAATLAGARFTEIMPGLWAARSGDGVAAAWVLLPSFGARLRSLLGAEVHVAVPHRDLVLASSADVPELGPLAEREAAKAPHAISGRPFALASAPLDVGLVATPSGLRSRSSLPPAEVEVAVTSVAKRRGG